MENPLITASAVRAQCGGVADMTLWRWLHDPAMAFPKPIYLCKRRYWRQDEITAWIDSQPRADRGAA
jgi:predicted DNA-binding transcriptional regulator AlpA